MGVDLLGIASDMVDVGAGIPPLYTCAFTAVTGTVTLAGSFYDKYGVIIGVPVTYSITTATSLMALAAGGAFPVNGSDGGNAVGFRGTLSAAVYFETSANSDGTITAGKEPAAGSWELPPGNVVLGRVWQPPFTEDASAPASTVAVSNFPAIQPTANGTTAATSLNAATANGNGTATNYTYARDKWTLQVITGGTAAPTAGTVQLQGSLNGTNWSNIGQSWDIAVKTSGDALCYTGYPFTRTRAVLAGLAGGTAPTVTALIAAA